METTFIIAIYSISSLVWILCRLHQIVNSVKAGISHYIAGTISFKPLQSVHVLRQIRLTYVATCTWAFLARLLNRNVFVNWFCLLFWVVFSSVWVKKSPVPVSRPSHPPPPPFLFFFLTWRKQHKKSPFVTSAFLDKHLSDSGCFCPVCWASAATHCGLWWRSSWCVVSWKSFVSVIRTNCKMNHQTMWFTQHAEFCNGRIVSLYTSKSSNLLKGCLHSEGLLDNTV